MSHVGETTWRSLWSWYAAYKGKCIANQLSTNVRHVYSDLRAACIQASSSSRYCADASNWSCAQTHGVCTGVAKALRTSVCNELGGDYVAARACFAKRGHTLNLMEPCAALKPGAPGNIVPEFSNQLIAYRVCQEVYAKIPAVCE